MTRWLPALAAGTALAAALTGCAVEVEGTGGGTDRTPDRRGAAAARADLKDLRTAAEGSGSGYERERFGVRWKDIDRNGCDQRNDVLARDLEKIEKRGDCVVVSGLLHDPYSGKDITFSKSDADEVQIDHLYPLALAWRMGADDWPADRRERFANDHDNLLAVWGVPNRQKSDSGPGEWKPQRDFQCTYAIRYIAVADEYALPVTRTDRTALDGFLDRC
ncbi:HNH endonuclease [Actinomadura craniellae]|uniref:HNH endonuclease n=1 Tax=Actinomadura craniellae TaxID=2231787 RepID=A0A365H7M8_9ACTN|nr:HNH endonuclease family protein [Actinomadura craniellae]RAY15120.1 HNH endonuclease [Actinomadura craniellae]